MEKKQCKHTLVHNEDKGFIFCGKCGKRWGEGKEINLTPQKDIKRYPWYCPDKITYLKNLEDCSS